MYDDMNEFGLNQKRGMSTGAKVGIGCGIAAVLVIVLICAGVVAFGWWMVKQMEEFEEEFTGQGYALVEGQVVDVGNPVDQPTFFAGQTVDIDADVNADIAIGAQNADIRGRVVGDIDFMGQRLTIHRDAVVVGDIRVRFAQQVFIRGRVEGEVTGTWQTIQREPRQDDADIDADVDVDTAVEPGPEPEPESAPAVGDEARNPLPQ